MLKTRGYATQGPKDSLKPFEFQRREPSENDVVIEIAYCGICHSDIHQARDEWGGSTFPMVPGHEIVGKVTKVGSKVKKFKVGDTAGVGCMVDSCRSCSCCKAGLEQFCEKGMTGTYNSMERDGKTPTYGGYSNQIVVDENYVLKVAPDLPLERVAPLLCAGITTFSPLRHWKVSKGDRVAVVGLGGLGHMAVKLAASMGAEVSVLSTSKSKEADARRLGANNFYVTKDPAVMEKLNSYFDFIVDTASAPHDYGAYLNLLRVDGVMILLGAPDKPTEMHAFPLIMKRRSLVGSLIGGIKETQEMLDYCAQNKIFCDVEVIPVSKINEAYERMLKGDVHYRFVIDMKTL